MTNNDMKKRHCAVALMASIAILAVLSIAGCGNKNTCEAADLKWDKCCDELKSAYEKGLAEVEAKGKNYDMTRLGDQDRTLDAWQYTLKEYRKIAQRLVKERGQEGLRHRQNTERWLAGALERLDAYRRKEEKAGNVGSYTGIFHLGNKIELYDRALRLLMLKTDVMKRWSRIAAAIWTVSGTTVCFTNGEASVNLPWRIFKPYEKSYAWAPYYEPKNTFSWHDRDYAVVRFPAEGCPEGCPATTEECLLFEFDNGKVMRVIGLNNYLHDKIEFDLKCGLIVLLGEDGYSNPVRFVIDLRTMRILKEGTTLPSEFAEDGYDKQFVEE